MRGLKGKNVLVTGGASGIGQATATRFLEEGCAVCVLDRSAEYSDAMLDAVNRKMPFGRHARPEEIAALFAFLASEDAGFASGHVYVMDGAETAGGLCSQWTHE
jgi:NAD(P)-dependent dehydrogenase (short-subunit alcohol dehydrogenase family)